MYYLDSRKITQLDDSIERMFNKLFLLCRSHWAKSFQNKVLNQIQRLVAGMNSEDILSTLFYKRGNVPKAVYSTLSQSYWMSEQTHEPKSSGYFPLYHHDSFFVTRKYQLFNIIDICAYAMKPQKIIPRQLLCTIKYRWAAWRAVVAQKNLLAQNIFSFKGWKFVFS